MNSKLPFLLGLLGLCLPVPLMAQQVCLPSPRLLTVMPMGGQVGTTVEVRITGESLEDVKELQFSDPRIAARAVLSQDGKAVENKFLVTIAPDAPVGVYDARVISRLGVSSARAFSTSRLQEFTREKPNNSVESAFPLSVNSICNATMTKRAVDYYSFKGTKGKRVVVDCAAIGIDSKLTPVVIIADAQGRDLVLNRTGGMVDFTPPADGTYLVKVHGLTFSGGAEHFYRLALREVSGTGPAERQPATATVSSMSWPPPGLAPQAKASEAEPNNGHEQVQKISLPCDIAGSFYPAADVDTYEFAARKGETWWVEVASERQGLNTDPFVVVQKVARTGEKETLTDVAELTDIASPVKVSSNGYSYDGPPYNAGSPDVLGKLEVREDGTYRLQVRDLFGGTRKEAGNVYRLIVRQAAPDFSLAAWAVHMTLRNGDRAALSKPIALRAGGAMVFEVVVIRRDGFDGEIELEMEGLPPGVKATGLKIAKGKSVGHVVLTAGGDAKPGFSVAKMFGRATIGGNAVTRSCRVASMEWPVRDAKQEIPSPRLMADIPVSVSDSEGAPLTVSTGDKVWEAKPGDILKIPLKLTWRNEFTASSVSFKAYGAGFEAMKAFDIPVQAASAEAVIDLAALKMPPGDYTLAFYGSAVTRYRYNPAAVAAAELAQKKAEQEALASGEAAKKLADQAANAPADKKSEAANAAKIATEKQKQAEAAMAEAAKRMKTVSAASAPKDTVEIIVSEPVRISVKAAQTTTAAVTPKP